MKPHASVACFLLFLATLLTGASPSLAEPLDFAIPNGHFYKQANGQGGAGDTGFAVVDDVGASFWSEFQRLGGVAAVGYPASQRFIWQGFTTQVFQRAIFQWRPECGCAMFVNAFDVLHDLGKDDWLLAVRQTPPPKDWSEAGKSWSAIIRDRLAVLDGYPAIRAKYYAVAGDPIPANGLPTSEAVDMGNHYVLRAQRVVFQQWKEDIPWARKGEVTVALGGDIAKETGILPDREALRPIAATAPQRVLAYYVPYDPTSWASLREHAQAIDYVGAQWVTIDACGNVGSRDDQTLKQFARAQGIKVLPSLLTGSRWLNHRILTGQGVADHAITQIVEYVMAEGYDGFDLDLEGVDAQDRTAYSAFVARLGSALHGRGKVLTLAVPAKAREVTTGWAGAYDYAALGNYADLIMIMTYEYRGAWSGPGPVAPYNWVDEVIAYVTSQIPAHKVAVGLAFYGYDWNTTSGGVRALRYPQAAELSNRYQVPIALDAATQSATFRYRAPASDPPPAGSGLPPLQHQITERRPPSCPATPPTPAPTPTRQPTPTPSGIQEHVVWLEESGSAAARLALARRYQTAGVGAWRLGQEDPGVWTVIQDWKRMPR